MVWTVGSRVKHSVKPEWGLGRIVAVQGDDKLLVRFKGAGKLLLKSAFLIPVTEPESAPPPTGGGPAPASGSKCLGPMGGYKQAFLDLFPMGFRDPRYVRGERAYKVSASQMLRTTLAKKRMQSLINVGNHDETCRLALAVVKATNLVYPNEKMDLADGLRAKGGSQRFSVALFGLLYGTGKFDGRFETFCAVLADIGAPQWTTATYFSYLAEPAQHMFLKPVATKRIAAACAVELNYRPSPNIVTYRSLLHLSERLAEELAGLKPRDNIDLQSFIWCVAR